MVNCTKRVKKEDLRKMIEEYYKRYVITDLRDEDILVFVNSVYVSIEDYERYESKETRADSIQKFSTEIENLTFGNLKVVKVTYEEDKGKLYRTIIDIASAYEVIEEEK